MRKFAMCSFLTFVVAMLLALFWVSLSMVVVPAEVIADALASSLMTDGSSINHTVAKVIAWICFVGVIALICYAFCSLVLDSEVEEEPKPKIPKVPRAKCHKCAHCVCMTRARIECEKFGLCNTRYRCEYMTPRLDVKESEGADDGLE